MAKHKVKEMQKWKPDRPKGMREKGQERFSKMSARVCPHGTNQSESRPKTNTKIMSKTSPKTSLKSKALSPEEARVFYIAGQAQSHSPNMKQKHRGD